MMKLDTDLAIVLLLSCTSGAVRSSTVHAANLKDKNKHMKLKTCSSLVHLCHYTNHYRQKGRY